MHIPRTVYGAFSLILLAIGVVIYLPYVILQLAINSSDPMIKEIMVTAMGIPSILAYWYIIARCAGWI